MESVFHLEVGQDRLATLTFDSPDRRVNVFTRAALEQLEALIDQLAERTDIGILILLSGKERNFIAGADVDMIAQIEDPVAAEAGVRFGQRVFAAWEALPFPTVAAIRGTAMGGGTEISLASTYRLVSDREDIRIGLPEVRLGIVPAWGGSTRLPRLIGLTAALDIILAGKSVRPKKAFKLGLVDALVPDATFLDAVRDFARAHVDDKKRDDAERPALKELLLERNPLGRKAVFSQARKKILESSGGHYPAPLAALEAVRAGIEDGLQAGFNAEARAAGRLATGDVAKNLIHVFQLMEEAKKQVGVADGEPRPVRQAAVVGAGVMGGGIAQLVVDKLGIPVRLKDIGDEPLASGMAHAARLFTKQVERRRLKPEPMRRKMALISPTLAYGGFERTDLVVEAVVEDLRVKQKVFAELAEKVGEKAVLASNTSSLSITEIGRDTAHPERVVGLHFFNPVEKMPLVEVIAGEGAAPWAVNTAFAFAKGLGKTPILVTDSPGFLVNRLLLFTMAEALWLLDEGYRIEDLDRTMKDWGLPMGPLELTDEVGIDVAVKVAHILHDAFGERLPVPVWLDRLISDKRLGTKNRRGFYRYEGKKRTEPDPTVYELLGLEPRVADPDRAYIVDRLVLPMVDEAARCLEEGVVGSPGDLDLAMILGTGFPPFRGGVCRWADRQGLEPIVGTLERFATEVGPRHEPSEALRRAAAAGGFYRTDWSGE